MDKKTKECIEYVIYKAIEAHEKNETQFIGEFEDFVDECWKNKLEIYNKYKKEDDSKQHKVGS